MWTKVCGLTSVDNSLQAVSAGVDAIGLNFYERSQRYVHPNLARDISLALAAESPDAASRELARVDTGRQQSGGQRLCDSDRCVDVVGLFVNASIDHMVQTVAHAGLTAVQFHGDETVKDVVMFHQQLPHIAIVRAFRIDAEHVQSDIRNAQQLAAEIPDVVCLLDTLVAGQYGGTGCRLDASSVLQFQQALPGSRIVIAGGLTPQNVRSAVEQFRPWGVDTASGVELEPGVKLPSAVAAFVNGAQGN